MKSGKTPLKYYEGEYHAMRIEEISRFVQSE
jgi:hypothetical protein